MFDSLVPQQHFCQNYQNLLMDVTVIEVCRSTWHSAGCLSWPFSMLKYKYIYILFQTKYTVWKQFYQTALHSETVMVRIRKMLIAV